MQHIFVVNPVAGKEDASVNLLPKFLISCRERGLSCRVETTTHPGHASEIAAACGRAGERACLYAFGGDGTLNEVAAGALPYPNLCVSAVPCGSGNDFVKSFGTATDFLDPGWISDDPAIVMCDMMTTNRGYSMGICSAGLDAAVAYNIPHLRRVPLLGGAMAYRLSVVKTVLGPVSHHLRVEMDGELFCEGDYLMATVANGSYYGSGFFAAPPARVDDGMLDVFLTKTISRLKMAAVIGGYQLGRHIVNGALTPEYAEIMQYKRCRSVRITSDKDFFITRDGECSSMRELSVSLLPRCLPFALPTPLAGGYEKVAAK